MIFWRNRTSQIFFYYLRIIIITFIFVHKPKLSSWNQLHKPQLLRCHLASSFYISLSFQQINIFPTHVPMFLHLQQHTSNGCISRHKWSRHIGHTGRCCNKSAINDGHSRLDGTGHCPSNNNSRLRWPYYDVTDRCCLQWICRNSSIHASICGRDNRPTSNHARLLTTHERTLCSI